MDGEGGMVNECRRRFDSNSTKLSGRKMRSWPRCVPYFYRCHEVVQGDRMKKHRSSIERMGIEEYNS